MKTVVFIQARLNSTRLPKKILKSVNGISMIEYQLKQLSFSKKINEVYLLVPNNDKRIKKFLNFKKIAFISGPEENVLERFYLATKKIKSDNIIRLTADCPLIDPRIIDKLVKFYKKNNLDYANLGTSFPEGQCAEIMSVKTLNFLKKNAKTKFEKEHVTILLRKKRKGIKVKTFEQTANDENLRYTLDHKEDFNVLKNIILSLNKNKFISAPQIKKYLKKNPKIKKLNSHIIRDEKTSNY